MKQSERNEPTGTMITNMRKSRGLSQTFVATAVGVTPKHMCEVEKGRKGASTSLIQNLIQLFGPSDQEMAFLSKAVFGVGSGASVSVGILTSNFVDGIERARHLLNTGHPYRALATAYGLTKRAKTNSQQAEVMMLIANAQADSGSLEVAEHYYTKAWELVEDTKLLDEVVSNLAALYVDMGRFRHARELFNSLLDSSDEKTRHFAKLGLARTYMERGGVVPSEVLSGVMEAVEGYKELKDSGKHDGNMDAWAWHILGRALATSEETKDEGLDILAQIADSGPQDDHLLQAHVRIGMYENTQETQYADECKEIADEHRLTQARSYLMKLTAKYGHSLAAGLIAIVSVAALGGWGGPVNDRADLQIAHRNQLSFELSIHGEGTSRLFHRNQSFRRI